MVSKHTQRQSISLITVKIKTTRFNYPLVNLTKFFTLVIPAAGECENKWLFSLTTGKSINW